MFVATDCESRFIFNQILSYIILYVFIYTICLCKQAGPIYSYSILTNILHRTKMKPLILPLSLLFFLVRLHV